MTPAATAAAALPAEGWRLPLAVALGALAAGLALVVLAVLATQAGADWFTDAPDLDVPGARFSVVRGTAHAAGSGLLLDAAPDGLAVVAATVAPFDADDHPRVAFDLRSARAPGEIAFIWRMREKPGRTFSRRLVWTGAGVAPLAMAADENWRGTIEGVGLAVRGRLAAPLEIAGLRLPSGAAASTLRTLFGQWTAFFPLQGSSVAFPFDRERTHALPLAPAVAIALGLAGGLAFVLTRGRRLDARVGWLLFALAWLVLDERWHVELVRAVATTEARYGGKTMEEKWLAADDAALYRIARDALRVLPPPPTRVLVLSGNPILGVRLGHYLYPHNVYSPLKPPGAPREDHRTAPDHDQLRAGDHLLLFFYGNLGYDAARGVLVWPDGHAVRVTPLLVRPDALLVRVD